MTSPGPEVGASISVVLTDGAIRRSIRNYNAKHDCLAMNMNSDHMSGKERGVAVAVLVCDGGRAALEYVSRHCRDIRASF
jgi:hypothetical protein